jgi:alpha/beta superfamily hydrolase
LLLTRNSKLETTGAIIMETQRAEIPCGKIILEGMIHIPEGPGPSPLVVVCHPHPLYGGSMHNNVVDAVCSSLEEKEIAWLKFNFRGVGRSGGRFGDGIGEKDDARAGISFGQSRTRIDHGKIGLCGYSFGSMVALPVAVEDARVKAVAGIAPFVQPENLLSRYARPKLLVCGTQDEFVDSKALEKIVEKMPDPKELALYPGVDHFWMGEEGAMGERVAQFFAKYLKA